MKTVHTGCRTDFWVKINARCEKISNKFRQHGGWECAYYICFCNSERVEKNYSPFYKYSIGAHERDAYNTSLTSLYHSMPCCTKALELSIAQFKKIKWKLNSYVKCDSIRTGTILIEYQDLIQYSCDDYQSNTWCVLTVNCIDVTNFGNLRFTLQIYFVSFSLKTYELNIFRTTSHSIFMTDTSIFIGKFSCLSLCLSLRVISTLSS